MKKFIILAIISLFSICCNGQLVWQKKFIKADELKETENRYDYFTSKTYLNTEYKQLRLDAPEYATFGGHRSVTVGLYNTNNKLIKKFEIFTDESQNGNNLWLDADSYNDDEETIINFILNDYGYVRFLTTVYGGREYEIKVWTVKRNIKPTQIDFKKIEREKFVADSIAKREKFVADSIAKLSKSAEDKVFNVVEQQPSFPGGPSALMQYLSSNIKYPVVAQANGVQGRVIVGFIVDKSGSIKNVHIIRGVDPALDREAERVISLMPNWNPGKENGQAVAVNFCVPVSFKIN